MSRRSGLLALLALTPLTGCSDDASPARAWVTRDTLPGGVVVVRYDDLPRGEIPEAVPDLRLGSVEGTDPSLSFADIRGIESGSDGVIYVLDYQASEVRAFDAGGGFLRTVARRGEGPGEISEANGIQLVGDSLLWIQDHGKWTMIGVTLEGEEVVRLPMPVRSYGYIWSGTVDDGGRFWRPTERSDQAPAFPPEEGMVETRLRSFMHRYDPASQTADSLYLGEVTRRTHVSENPGGFTFLGVPFLPELLTAVDPGGGLWQANGGRYRIAKLDERGDTVLVIEATAEPLPVTAADRDAYVERASGRGPERHRAAEEVAAALPELKPVLDGLVVDDQGRLWVGLVVPPGDPPLYDVFASDGRLLGSLRLGFEPNSYLPLRIRHGRIYALVQDALDVPFVVRADVPAELGG